MKDLILIPARGGSKGIPGKNIKPLNGRPLIYYTLATDTASSYDVIRHAIGFYQQKGIDYDRVILLQPTSPFRRFIIFELKSNR